MSGTTTLANDLLKSKMVDAMVDRGLCADLDTCLTPGIYTTNSSTKCANPPSDVLGMHWQYGIVEVMERYGTIFQRLTGQTGCVMRYINMEGEPRAWMTICSA